MKIQSIAFLLSTLAVSCSNGTEELEEFKSAKLYLNLEQSDTSLGLNGSEIESDLLVSKVSIICGEKEYIYDLDEEGQADVFMNLTQCSIRAEEMVKFIESPSIAKDQGKDALKIIYTRQDDPVNDDPSLFYFIPDSNEELDSSLKVLLVKAVTDLTLERIEDGCNFQNCKYYNASATIIHSDLIEVEVERKNPDDYSKLTVDAALDPVANCDFNVEESVHDTENSLRFTVLDCEEADLSFALKNVKSQEFSEIKDDMSIELAKDIHTSNSLVSVEKLKISDDLYRYTIVESYEKIMDDLKVDTLATIFSEDSNSVLVVDIDDENNAEVLGLSSLVFYVQNSCKLHK